MSAEKKPKIFCAGIAVLDELFRIRDLPQRDHKTDASEYVVTGGGCAPNAAVAIARLGGNAAFAGPLGDDETGERVLKHLAREGIDTSGCIKFSGCRTSVSAILIDASGARTIATYTDQQLMAVSSRDADRLIADADCVLLDNRRPKFVGPFLEAAVKRKLPIVLDVDKATAFDDPLLVNATHAIFSGESLRASTKCDGLVQGFDMVREKLKNLIAVTDGHNGGLWCDGGEVHAYPAFKVDVIDTLGAGDTFHGAFALALIEGKPITETLRFASAAAALKCIRFGGITSAPTREAVDKFLNQQA